MHGGRRTMAVPNARFVKWKLGDRQKPLKRADQLRCTFDAPFSLTVAEAGLKQRRCGGWTVPTLRGGMARGLLSLSREMKVKKAETARYFSFSASEATSTSTSISIDLLLMNVSRPVTVTTQPGGEIREKRKKNTFGLICF